MNNGGQWKMVDNGQCWTTENGGQQRTMDNGEK